MSIKALYDGLSTKLNLLRLKVTTENKVNDYSINVLLENTARKMLNILLGYNFTNANLIEHNFPGVDLIDENNKVVVQVSSSGTAEKITHTLRQTKKLRLKDDYDSLMFFFLGEVRNFSAKSISSIKKLSKDTLRFNIDNDIYDTNTVYKILYHEQNIHKTLKIINILDELLGFIPETKRSGFDSISVAFDDNNKNAIIVIDFFLKEGFNVYINSQKVYEEFNKAGHKSIDYLILINEYLDITHIKYTIVIIDKNFISRNNGLSNIKCTLLRNALDNDSRIQLLVFNNSVNIKSITNENFKNGIPCTKDNIIDILKVVKEDFLKEENSIFLSQEEITQELVKIYKNFTLTILNDDEKSEYWFLKFDLKEFSSVSIYYILLSKDYILNSVKDHINEKFRVPRNRIIVLVSKDPLQKTNRKLDNIKKALSTDKVQYVSEHLFEKTLKQEKQEKILNISDFVDPIIRFQDQLLNGTDAIINWVTVSSSSSVALISGQGGIGKTTLCQKIHDKLISESNKYHVIFINSTQLINEFLKIDFSNKQEYDIYNLYRISCSVNLTSGNSVLEKSSFEINYELGNILIVFDGIDELISTIHSFSLELFLNNVSKIKAGIGRGKIIVNCRDTYVEDFIKKQKKLAKTNTDIFELLPFNERLAKEYFVQHFSQSSKIRSGITLLQEFVKSEAEDEYIYPPFVVEIVRLFVDKEIDVTDGDETFQSNYLIENNVNDLIIFKTCYREIAKKETHGFDLSVDKQVEFMMEIAYELNGQIEESDFEKILKRINCKDRTSEMALGLKDHPFLIKENSKHFFRFDFLNTLFKSVYIKSILDNPKEEFIDRKLIYFFSEEMDYYSQTTRNLLPKIRNNIEYYSASAKSIIRIIQKSKDAELSFIRKATSNLFVFLVQASGIENTKLSKFILLGLFQVAEDYHIDGLCLIGISRSINLILDLKDLYFSNTFIENYDQLLLCEFNSNTFFDHSCEINKVGQYLFGKENISVSINHFDSNIKGDNTLIKSLTYSDDHKEKTKIILITKSLKFFCKSFYNGNVLNVDKSVDKIKLLYNHMGGIIDIDLIISRMEEQEIITKDGDYLKINQHYKSKIAKFVNESLNFNELNIILSNLKETIKL